MLKFISFVSGGIIVYCLWKYCKKTPKNIVKQKRWFYKPRIIPVKPSVDDCPQPFFRKPTEYGSYYK